MGQQARANRCRCHWGHDEGEFASANTGAKVSLTRVQGTYREYNFDGLVGPTHNYGGLSLGNLASMSHEGRVSNPRRAALDGLAKMRFVMSLGVGQAVLPPHERPSLATLRSLGFCGRDEDVLAQAAHESPLLVRLVSSASSMWTANAATVTPSCDAADRRLHITPANLASLFHRSIEPRTTERVLRSIFADGDKFEIHRPLPSVRPLCDEGAANHTRLETVGGSTVHLFGWGRRAWDESVEPQRYPARQTFEASRAVARLHQLDPSMTLFVQQAPESVDAGAFHSDVLSVGTGSFLMLHEMAFVNAPEIIEKLGGLLGPSLRVSMASSNELALADAVASYAFNSQLLPMDNGTIVLLAPEESRANGRARAFLERVVGEDNPVQRIEYVDLHQSMNNGGGPACLRLRVPLRDDEVTCIRPKVLLTEELYQALVTWVERHHRDRLLPENLCDPALMRESMTALDELTAVLELGSIYDFQQDACARG